MSDRAFVLAMDVLMLLVLAIEGLVIYFLAGDC